MSHEYEITLDEHSITIKRIEPFSLPYALDMVYLPNYGQTQFYCTEARFQLLRKNRVFVVRADRVQYMYGDWYVKLPTIGTQRCTGFVYFNDHLRDVWWCLRRLPEDIARVVMEFTFFG